MKFAVLAALVGLAAAEHEMEGEKMDDMRMEMRDEGMCEFGMHLFYDDSCRDKMPDGTMMWPVPNGSCHPFDMMRDTIFLDVEMLA